MARRRHSHNAVRITYYVESPDVRSHHKIKPHPFSRKPQTTRTCGYDRRAELLAYANHLREADPETVHWSRKFQSSKPKKWKWSATPARVRAIFHQIFQGTRGRWKYQRMVPEEKISSRKKNSSRRSISLFCKKLKCALKELPFGGNCSKM
ncbi:hypothetical protein KPL70_015969 [Citrus sinensis]|nr:hypothetical protein KPL70_015969 [Citrus sinensis]